MGSEADGYRLTVSGYGGTAGDSLDYETGMKFSTKDRDQDNWSRTNCAEQYKGGWLFRDCYKSFLNGPYLYGERAEPEGIHWWYVPLERHLLLTEGDRNEDPASLNPDQRVSPAAVRDSLRPLSHQRSAAGRMPRDRLKTGPSGTTRTECSCQRAQEASHGGVTQPSVGSSKANSTVTDLMMTCAMMTVTDLMMACAMPHLFKI